MQTLFFLDSSVVHTHSLRHDNKDRFYADTKERVKNSRF
ncbi:hypothetical protein HFN_1803 [Helicobacter fennelliae MRY12-0050]|uniref:Uncharacterized protein n=1 Tax=Helicobacter fennelliae MRY12-0050 TaxID=1325130 RepID=T1CWH1_9HELI|nr:hypothetical protein HFN_1803 [Helicobacter fennelliae MRY12-0050]